jgi:hypothetical protein
MLRVWMKILQQGPSSAKLNVIPLPSNYESGEVALN